MGTECELDGIEEDKEVCARPVDALFNVHSNVRDAQE